MFRNEQIIEQRLDLVQEPAQNVGEPIDGDVLIYVLSWKRRIATEGERLGKPVDELGNK